MAKQSSSSLCSAKLAKYFKDYATHHRTSGNQITHYFGIPFIVISLLGLLSHWVIEPAILPAFSFFQIDGGTLVIVLGMLWYLYLDWKIAIPFGFVISGLYFLGRALPVPVNWALFIGGWILQGVGHAVYEKKSPAFVTNIMHGLVGPIWVFAKMIRYY